ncbi:MAG: asparagine synthase (glutamine-hydrolyzing) [Patescibacteria group bacterium]|jgi:asparagine synthase (glutamine-hydrolysing)
MCGIAGIVTKNGAPLDEGLLRGMSGAIRHRGPDGEGIWTGSGVGFAHRRLAIIDLDPRAAQPMQDRMGELAIIFNGEIYNYKELRTELSAEWETESDTEVILEGYRVWGDDVVTKLRGMFAFALWDTKKNRLLIARDRIGKKPLFYATAKNGDFVFASEIKAFKDVVNLKPDMDDVRTFLGLQYVPTPRTGFIGVSQLAPGHIGIMENGKLTTHPYHMWSRETCKMSNGHIDEGIRNRLDEAVKLRMLASDVPVGAFLSGGVDSAAVVAYASKYVDKLQTFTMGFDVASMDERKEAREIAEKFNTEHHEFIATPEDLLRLVDDLVEQYDAPYADSSALPLWLLAQETSKHIKVVLTGDGGDETFGGYKRYLAYLQALELAHLPLLNAVTAPAVHWLGRVIQDPRFERFGQMANVMQTRPEAAYGELFCGAYFNSCRLEEMCQPEFLKQTKDSDAVSFVAKTMGGSADLDAAMYFDLTSYLPDDLNVKMDRATMKFGLEARAPFLDQDLVQFALGLPLEQKVHAGQTKVSLKRAMRSILPSDVLDRKKKGFQVPLAEWFRGPLKDLVQERCLGASSPLRTILKPEAIERLINENQDGADHGNRLWMLLTLSTWLSKHV